MLVLGHPSKATRYNVTLDCGEKCAMGSRSERKLVVAESELREDVVSVVSSALQQVPVTMSSR